MFYPRVIEVWPHETLVAVYLPPLPLGRGVRHQHGPLLEPAVRRDSLDRPPIGRRHAEEPPKEVQDQIAFVGYWREVQTGP